MAERHDVRALDFAAVFEAVPTPCLVLDRALVIVAVNGARERVTGRTRADVVGRYLFDAFPDNPSDPTADGVHNLHASLQRVLATGRPDVMPVQRYDIEMTGEYARRWWSPVNAPVVDETGEVALILHRVEDVTEYMRQYDRPPADRAEGVSAGLLAAVAAYGCELDDPVAADVWARGRELRAALTAEAVAATRLAGLVEVAARVAAADSVAELTDLVFASGLGVLGADAAVVAVPDPDGRLELTFTDSLPAAARELLDLAQGELPISVAATGLEVLLPDARAATRWSPAMSRAVATTGLQAWAALPLHDTELLGSLTICWRDAQEFTERDQDLMRAFAGLCAQTLARLQAQEQEQQLVAAEHDLAAALQRTLLSPPTAPADLDVAVRYLPATAGLQVGGDWYDCFLTPDGTTTLVIGDVTGHDRDAAASMAQLRNLLRGVCVAGPAGPAAALSGLEDAAHALSVGALATVVLAQLSPMPDQTSTGARTLRWSNAGHLPPALIPPSGPVRLLETTPELLVGLTPDAEHRDHTLEVELGSTLVLYTDGLVEGRHSPLQDGLDWLLRRLEALRQLPAERFCDALLAGVPPRPRGRHRPARGANAPRRGASVAGTRCRQHPAGRAEPTKRVVTVLSARAEAGPCSRLADA